MEKKSIKSKFDEKSIVPTKESKIIIINNKKENSNSKNNIVMNSKSKTNENKNNTNNNSDAFEDLFLKYSSLFNDDILGRFTVLQKINIVNKLNIVLFNKIKKELQLQLKRKQLENELLKLRNGYKDKLIKKKKLYSLIQQKMLKDYNFKRKLKDLRKKLMDERINFLRYKNLMYIMRSYGICNEEKYYR